MHWMILPLKRYAEFSGRSRRKEYWMFVLGMVLFYLALVLLMGLLMGGAMLGALQGSADSGADAGAGMVGAMLGGGIIGIVILLTWLFLLIPSIAVGVRRLHDIDRTGWWLMLGYGPYILSVVLAMVQSVELAAILNIVSMIGFLVLLVFAFMPGTRGPNRYGPDPKGENLGEVFA
ncbi:MAG: DUF805 domain-containing protein [Allosphingosinicella sp.]